MTKIKVVKRMKFEGGPRLSYPVEFTNLLIMVPASEVGVEDPTDDGDALLRDPLLCAVRRAVAHTYEPLLVWWDELQEVNLTPQQQHTSVKGPQLEERLELKIHNCTAKISNFSDFCTIRVSTNPPTPQISILSLRTNYNTSWGLQCTAW